MTGVSAVSSWRILHQSGEMTSNWKQEGAKFGASDNQDVILKRQMFAH